MPKPVSADEVEAAIEMLATALADRIRDDADTVGELAGAVTTLIEDRDKLREEIAELRVEVADLARTLELELSHT